MLFNMKLSMLTMIVIVLTFFTPAPCSGGLTPKYQKAFDEIEGGGDGEQGTSDCCEGDLTPKSQTAFDKVEGSGDGYKETSNCCQEQLDVNTLPVGDISSHDKISKAGRDGKSDGSNGESDTVHAVKSGKNMSHDGIFKAGMQSNEGSGVGNVATDGAYSGQSDDKMPSTDGILWYKTWDARSSISGTPGFEKLAVDDESLMDGVQGDKSQNEDGNLDDTTTMWDETLKKEMFDDGFDTDETPDNIGMDIKTEGPFGVMDYGDVTTEIGNMERGDNVHTNIGGVDRGDNVHTDITDGVHQGKDGIATSDASDENTTISTTSIPNRPSANETTDGNVCLPSRYRGHWWPKTPAGTSAYKPCLLFDGDIVRHCVQRKLNLLNHKARLPHWTEPDYSGCITTRRDRTQIDPCPYDTSYATEWLETPANQTATAPCPRTMGVNETGVMATRRCEIQWDGEKNQGVWLDPYLVDCVVASLDSKIPPQEETVDSSLDMWMNDNSCMEDATNSTVGSFQWNTTIVGGIDQGTCPHGSLVPPPEVITFMKLSIGILSALMDRDRWSNSTFPNATEHWDFSKWNITDGNETLQMIKDELINRTTELIQNITYLSRSNFDHDYDQGIDMNTHDQSIRDGSYSQTSDQPITHMESESSYVQEITTNFWWVDIGKAVDAMDQQKTAKDSGSLVAILDVMQLIDDLQWSSSINNMLPAILIDKGKLLVDLRGLDAVATAVDDLLNMDRQRQFDGLSHSRKKRDVVDEDAAMDEIKLDYEEVENDEDKWVSEEDLLFNITAVMDAIENAVKFPTRKCEENRVRAGVVWKPADTWMCRTENVSAMEDIARLLDDIGYLDKVNEILDELNLGEKIDGTLFRLVFKMWQAFDLWRQTRQKTKLTINAIQAISYLLSLDDMSLPPWLSQQIVQMIEDMANEPLPEDITSVDIVTEHVVVNIAEVEKAEFPGITFASIDPSSNLPGLSESGSDCEECKLGDNVFMRLEGALNTSLDILDMNAVDEYFYLPHNIFNLSARTVQNNTHCAFQDEIEYNQTMSSSSSEDTTPLLQFVIYENDQLFRTKSGEVPVSLAPDSSQTLNSSKTWHVATRVISGTVGGYCMSGLMQPVVFSMRHRFDISDSDHRLCVFWDYSERGGLGAWSTDGCQVDWSSNSQHTTCKCDHLTNFAVIVDIWDQLGKGRIPVSHDSALGIISLIGCTLSIVGLLVTLACLVFVKRLRESKTTPTRIMLCGTLLVSMLFLILGMDRTEDPDACAVFAFFIHYFTLTSLMWMGIEAVYLYRNIIAVVINPNKNFFHYCCGIAWGVPAVICAITAASNWDAYGDENWCWISEVGVFFGAFLAPVLVIVTLNFVVFGMVLCVLSNRPKDRIAGGGAKSGASVHREPARKWKELMGIASITVLLGLTWIFGAFSVGNGGARVVFLYLFTIFNSAQGFFIFIFYCLLSLIGGKKTRTCQRSSDKMTSPSVFSSTKKSASMKANEYPENEVNAKTEKLMADLLVSNLHLDIGAKDQDGFKGEVNKAVYILDEGGKHDMTSSAGDLALNSGLGIVMSAQLIHMDSPRINLRPTTVNNNSGGAQGANLEFVISSGIIFGGGAK